MQGESIWRARAANWLQEPFVHFLVAGLALFAFFAVRGEEVDPESRIITIDEAQVSRLAASWQQTWQRPPSPTEIDNLIRDHIKEEVYYREAIRLGLDQDDTVIRRRLRAKMEYLATAQAENAPVDDATLQTWLDKNPARYAAGAAYSFDQIYLGTGDPKSAAAQARNKLSTGTDWAQVGVAISLPRTLDAVSTADIARNFGEEFAAGLAKLSPGDWSGPLTSGFGSHLIRLRKVDPGKAARLADVRQQVENDWRSATQKAREAKAYQALLDGYTIQIAKP
jgi:hypothetical protein